MPLLLVRNSITNIPCEAIVNPTDDSLTAGDAPHDRIHRTAGECLLRACRSLGGCPVGEARITAAYDLPSRFVIHTVSPSRSDGQCAEALLRACYRNSLALAVKNGCETVAFPLLSCGDGFFPKGIALQIAADEIRRFLLASEDITVYLAVPERDIGALRSSLSADFRAYLDEHCPSPAYASAMCESLAAPSCPKPKSAEKRAPFLPKRREERLEARLEEALLHLDESFSQILLRKITERGMTDAECYKKANIDRKHFSKIRSDINYRPRKRTVLAFAVALELSLPETKELLEKAGFALTHASKADIIIEYFIRQGNYNIFEINTCLFAEDQELLGQ